MRPSFVRIEHRAPRFELAHAIGRFPGVELGHPPVVHVLAAAHRVGEVTFQLSRSSTLASAAATPPSAMTGVRLAEQRLADQPDLHAGRRRFDRRAQPAPPAPMTRTS
jgi:hypothetical protein